VESVYIVIKILNKIKELNKSTRFFRLGGILPLFLKFVRDLTLNEINFTLIFINRKNFVNFNRILFKKFLVKFLNIISI